MSPDKEKTAFVIHERIFGDAIRTVQCAIQILMINRSGIAWLGKV